MVHLEDFFAIFPQARLLVVVRDGRDLVQDSAGTVADLLPYLGLDAAPGFLEGLSSTPVKGSSSLRDQGDVHWSAVARTATFQPVGRWTGWPERRKQWFLRLAGPELDCLGYQRQSGALQPPRPLALTSARRLMRPLADRGVDALLGLRQRAVRAV